MDALSMAVYAYDQLPRNAKDYLRYTKEELEFMFLITPHGPIIQIITEIGPLELDM